MVDLRVTGARPFAEVVLSANIALTENAAEIGPLGFVPTVREHPAPEEGPAGQIQDAYFCPAALRN